jgi:hypothetical protein
MSAAGVASAATATATLPPPFSHVSLDSLDAPLPFITAPGKALDNLLDGYKLVPATGDVPAHAVYTKDLIKSPNDDRQYRYASLVG